jgi:putative nucleotidyltransferase with HDIG domain
MFRGHQRVVTNTRGDSPVREVFPGTRRYTQHTVFELAETIRERDIVTYEHCRRVAIYANRLARHMGWHRRAARELTLAGLIHDLGKTWVQNSVLHKPTALSQDEWRQMQRHPVIAARILMTYDVSDELIEIVLHHHEAFDGSGYPDHLAGEAIPLGARLLTVTDVFDALTSARSYKEPLPLQEVRERIGRSAGVMFDPAVVSAFLELLDATPDFQLASRAVPAPAEQIPGWDNHDTIE